jgi:predicted amidophosphoribosyltransferase
LVVLAIIFGVGRLSELGSAMGKSVRELRSAVRDEPVAPPAPVVPPVACAACGASNPATNRFCSTCGASMTAPPASVPAQATPAEPATVPAEPAPATAPPVRENICPSCATANPPGQPFCGQCGTRLTSAAA